MPQLLVRAPPWVRGAFDHAWAPVMALTEVASCLPDTLCRHLLGCDTGFVFIHSGDSYYAPGPAVVRHRPVDNVAYVSVEDLALENERPLHVLAHLIDHQLGAAGEPDGAWLSEGGGPTPDWREAGSRLAGLFALGYAIDDVAATDLRDYFAQSLAYYCREPRRLNVADPQIHKWLRSTLWNEAFWQGQKGREA
jgi:hypothetical protein